MDLGSILLILALVIMTGAFIAYPLLERKTQGVSEKDILISALLADRDRLLDSLLNLDSDQELGKVSEVLFAEQRSRLMVDAAKVMAELDEQMDDTSPELDDLLADRKTGKATDSLDEMIASRRSRRSTASSEMKFCPECGAKLEAGDKFCISCGTSL